MKNTTIILTIFTAILHFNNYAQEFRPKYGLDFQFGANAPGWGLKFHRNFYLNHNSHITFGTGIGVGGGHFPFTLMNDFTYSIGRGRNYLEAGVIGLWTAERYYTYEKAFFGSTIGGGNYVFVPLIGYKYISPNFTTLRLHFTPIISNERLYAWGGISLGIHFRDIYHEKINISTVRFATK